MAEIITCSKCGVEFKRFRKKQGTRCRPCINVKQKSGLTKRRDSVVDATTFQVMTRPWTKEGLQFG